MKSYSNVTCAVLSPLDISKPERGKQFLDLLERHPFVTPTKIGNSEPIIDKFDGPTKSIGKWTDPVLWQNAKVEGSAWFGHGNKHSCIYWRLKPKNCNQNALKSFFLDTCQLFKADFGYIHLMTQEEMGSSEIPYDCNYAIDVGVTTKDLEKGIPNLCWATVFGECYGKLVNTSQQPGLHTLVEYHQQSEQTYIQLTPMISDVSQNYAAFDEVRQKRKPLLESRFSARRTVQL
jgi:hypothetical protein